MTLLLPPQTVARVGVPVKPRMRQLTVDEYHRMIAAGILHDGEPVELLGGYMVFKDRSDVGGNPMSIGERHLWGVKNLARLGEQLRSHGCHMQTQGPVVMSGLDEPEPDGSIIQGDEDDYKNRIPPASVVGCVIEVSHSSLTHDRTEKVITYADSGIKQYVIINLVDDVVEEHTQPRIGKGRYGQIITLNRADSVQFMLPNAGVWAVPVQKLLP